MKKDILFFFVVILFFTACHQHEFDCSVTQNPTCTETGVQTYTCVHCGYQHSEEIPALGHSWGPGSRVSETDNEIIVEHTCTRCEIKKQVISYFYVVGDIGPAGGWIFYDCDADNNIGNADKLVSSECGWRYLEAAPADLRLVNDYVTADSSYAGYETGNSGFMQGLYCNSADDLYMDPVKAMYVNGTEKYDEGNCTSSAIGSGKKNTDLLVSAMGITNGFGNAGNVVTTYAARMCSLLECNGYHDWFLPSAEELNLMYNNLKLQGIGDFVADNTYWSSSEGDYVYTCALTIYFNNGNMDYCSRGLHEDFSVRAIRAFDSTVEQLSYSYETRIVAASCTEPEYTTYICKETGESYTIISGEKYGHTYDCVKNTGNITYCSRCGTPIYGPAGGYIFYDKGSYSDGWRYLEMAPADITTSSSKYFVFGYYRKTADGDNLFVNGSTKYIEGTSKANDMKSTGTAIGTGKANTTKLVSAMGDAAYCLRNGSSTTADYAARLCDDYTYNGYDDWFLPSKDELNLMYCNLAVNGLGDFTRIGRFFGSPYFSSSERDVFEDEPGSAWYENLIEGGRLYVPCGSECCVRAVRAF